MVLSAGIEPAAPPSEGGILSIELREDRFYFDLNTSYMQ